MERMVGLNETGKCPCCESSEYERVSLELFDDAIFAKCKCECGNSFEETFRLRCQHWKNILEVDENGSTDKIHRTFETTKR